MQKMKTLQATGSYTKSLEDKFSSVLEIAPDAIVIVDKGGRIVLPTHKSKIYLATNARK